MRFYTRQHKYYCGIDLHARTMYVCVLNQEGQILLHQNIRCDPQILLQTIQPYREDLVVAVECIFTWHGLADLCARENIIFILGHAGSWSFTWCEQPSSMGDTFHRLRSLPGVGKVLALTILYQIHDIRRFPRVQDFVSYARLVKCAKESSGKRLGDGGNKIGNVHLQWAFSEAAVLYLRKNPAAQKLHHRLQQKHGKGKALSILTHKLGRAAYYMLQRGTVFDANKFMNA